MEEKKSSAMGFILPSLIGIFLFMIPIEYDDKWTVVVKVVSDWLAVLIGEYLPLLCVIIVTLSAVLSAVFYRKPNFVTNYPVIGATFSTSFIWVIIRIIGAIFIWLVYLKAEGDIVDFITDKDAGSFVLNDLLCVLVIIFFLAGMLLPLLLDFGLLEFIGALFSKIMRPVFTIPGRAAVDCITSWIGDGTLGVMLTANQYETGYYSKREAAIISTTFSAVSITFSIVVLAQVGLMEYFGVYYLTICAVGFVCAVILPRIPPLSLKKDDYMVEGKAVGESLPDEYSSSFKYGIALAKARVAEHKGISEFLENSIKNAAGMWFGVLPVVMCIGTIALMLANNTPVFEILGKPFMPLLTLLDVPQAAEASKTMIVGFTDMFTPSIIAAGSITEPMTRFIVAVISVTQLIYLSEVGGLILGSKIPVNIVELFAIFLERTIISLLIVAPVAHLVF
ncbi:MAG: YjiH family protein [Selenomonadaceae bacterium]|nr:YjiH family protein [Selenomonadaceae bacterium]